jgi:hypothetical protein
MTAKVVRDGRVKKLSAIVSLHSDDGKIKLGMDIG